MSSMTVEQALDLARRLQDLGDDEGAVRVLRFLADRQLGEASSGAGSSTDVGGGGTLRTGTRGAHVLFYVRIKFGASR